MYSSENENQNDKVENAVINQEPLSREPMPQESSFLQPIEVKKSIVHGERFFFMKEHFEIYGIGCIVYGILFTICLYKGINGIGMTLMSLVGAAGLMAALKCMGVAWEKKDLFYLVSWVLLGLSSFLTRDTFLAVFNVVGVWLLVLGFLLTKFYDTRQWGFGRHMAEVAETVFAPLGYLGELFDSFGIFLGRKEKKNSKAKYVWLGLLISLPLLFVVIVLLSSADIVFANLFSGLFDWLADIAFPEHPIWIAFLAFVGIWWTYCLLAYLADGLRKDQHQEGKKSEPMIAITFMSMLTVVYLVFSVIQVLFLFVGNFALPEGYTYSAYAREGFFQLLFVCMLNLVLLLLCLGKFGESKVLNVVLTVFSACTYIMIASSAMRMILYTTAYKLTYDRLLVLWGLVVLAVLLFGCMVQIWKKEFPLFTFSMVTVTVLYIILSLGQPETVIAKYNLSKENPDILYLTNLNEDVVPILLESGALDDIIAVLRSANPEGHMDYVTENVKICLERTYDAYQEMGVMDFNLAIYRAGKAIEAYAASVNQ